MNISAHTCSSSKVILNGWGNFNVYNKTRVQLFGIICEFIKARCNDGINEWDGTF